MTEAQDSLVGKLLAGKYRLVRELSRGGMGQIYLAEHVDLQEPRAIKVIREELVADEATRRRFLREIRATHRVSKHNEHVVLIYDDYGFQDGIGYYVMEFLDGRPLSQFIQKNRGTLPIAWCLRVIIEIALAMDEIHRADVIHRDLKPDNVMLIERPGKPDLVKVFDFGIAKFKDIETRSTSMTQLVGTISYMSPEQISVPLEYASSGDDTGDIDHRSDVYALGCILFEMLVGKTPFAPDPTSPAMAPHQLLWAHLHNPPPSVRSYRPEVSEHLEQIIFRALQKQREDRYQSMQELADVLSSVLAQMPKDSVSLTDWDKHGPLTWVEKQGESVPRLVEPMDPTPRVDASDGMARILVERGSQSPLVLSNETKTLNKGEVAAILSPAYDPYQSTMMLNPWGMRTKVEASPWEARTILDTDLAEIHGSWDISDASVSQTLMGSNPPAMMNREDAFPPVSVFNEHEVLHVERDVDHDAKHSIEHDILSSAVHRQEPETPTLVADSATNASEVAAWEPPPFPMSPHMAENETALSSPPTVETKRHIPQLEVPVYSSKAPRTQPSLSDPGRKRIALFLWIVSIFLCLGAGVAFWLAKDGEISFRWWMGTHSRATSSDAVASSEKCPPQMVYFPEGRFLFGSATNDDLRAFYEAALRTETTKAYCIDTHEFPGKGKMPTVNVTYQEAQDYCLLRKKRLCTELEWERACKGESIYRYPYGNHFEPSFCNTRDEKNKNRLVVAGGQFAQCRNSFGLYDMSGNVAEWTDSSYRPGVEPKSIRGGAANRPDWAVRCASRSAAEPTQRKDTLGFRCCATPLKP